MQLALISGGINALQGKRGSDLLKSTVRDTAIAAALGGMQQPTPGADASGISGLADTGVATQSMKDFPISQGGTGKDVSKLGQFFSKVEKPFLKPGSTNEISKFRVGLGAAGVGGALFDGGAFDPKPAPDPKYPGYNRFYAADSSMFQPFSGKKIDYSKYPEGSPYSGMQEGGEVMSPDDEMLQFDMQQQTMADGPGIVGYLRERFDESFMSRPTRAMMRRPSKTMQPNLKQLETRNPTELMQKFRADPDRAAVELAVEMRDQDRVTIADVQRAKDLLQRLASGQETGDETMRRTAEGIGSLLEEADIRIPEAPDAPAQVQELMDTFRSRASNEPASNQFNKGDIVDVLPSKLKRDENDESNYKRTSGKMVTDETGKGSGNKDTMLAQLADGEFVTKAKSVLGAGKAMGGKSKKEQRRLGAQFFYKQMAELEKMAD